MLQSILNLLFPDTCAGCHKMLTDNEKVICTNCRHEIPLTYHHKNYDNEAIAKFYGKIEVEFAAAFMQFYKKGIVQQIIHELKYKGNEEIGLIIGNWYAQELKNVEKLTDVDFIVPVPLHAKKLRQRGYNQVDSFAKALSNQLKIPFNDAILRRNLYSKTQTKKNIFARSEIAQSIFGVYFDETHHYKHFLLVDDVITTGSTLEACGRELLSIPGARLSIVCMAITQ